MVGIKKHFGDNQSFNKSESFKPISVKSPSVNPLFFWFRCIIDLQLKTIVSFLRPALKQLGGNILDVGAGESPWLKWIFKKASYVGVDLESATDFGMTTVRKNIIYYDGQNLPFDSESFDVVLCVEVLEHVENPVSFIREIVRVLCPGGRLILTIPFSARRHHIPNDYQRFTREGLHLLLSLSKLSEINIKERGNDICVIANKITVLILCLVKPKHLWQIIYKWPISIMLLPILLISIFMAHLSLFFGFGSKEDPLGYYVEAKKLIL